MQANQCELRVTFELNEHWENIQKTICKILEYGYPDSSFGGGVRDLWFPFDNPDKAQKAKQAIDLLLKDLELKGCVKVSKIK